MRIAEYKEFIAGLMVLCYTMGGGKPSMNTMTIDIHDAQSQLLKLLSLAQQGQEIVIAENEIPIVRFVPVPKVEQRRIAGLHRGAMRMHDDFNDPLPDEFWLGNSG